MTYLIRLFSKIYKFNTLRIANWYFKDKKIVKTKLFGYEMSVNTERSTMHRLLALVSDEIIPERHLLRTLFKPDSVIIDVGSNIGYYAAFFSSKISSKGKIICIEPEPENLVELKKFINDNNISNIEIIEAAVGDNNGSINFTYGVNGHIVEEKNSGFLVPMIKLDNFIDTAPELIKIDIEGFEGQAILGMEKIMSDLSPALFVEIHPNIQTYGYTIESILQLCKRHYNLIEFFQLSKNNSIITKFINRYFRRHKIRQIDINVVLKSEQSQNTIEDTFWMICKKTNL